MDNPQGRFRPEMFGSIHHIESTARMPVVPASAVIEGDGRSIVFVESAPGTFQERVGRSSARTQAGKSASSTG